MNNVEKTRYYRRKGGDAKNRKYLIVLIIIFVLSLSLLLCLAGRVASAISEETQQVIPITNFENMFAEQQFTNLVFSGAAINARTLGDTFNAVDDYYSEQAQMVEKEPELNHEATVDYFVAREFTERDIDLISQTVWGEARGTSAPEWRLVVWTILQRVDNPDRWCYTTEGVVTQHRQFHGFSPNFPTNYYVDGVNIRDIVIEELEKWVAGEAPPLLYPFATSLPYFYFWGDYRPGRAVHHNWFSEEWKPSWARNR